MNSPAFLITIDTEGDNLWSKPETITTNNAFFLYRFQEVCEKFKFKPTYLTNYEMAKSKEFVNLGKSILKKDVAEIGMHLHAWNTPPAYSLTDDDYYHQPYLIEYPQKVMEEKIHYLTNFLEDTFQTKMLSHRAGRWALDERYLEILINLGYKIDCSVTPHISWRQSIGEPNGRGGVDYSSFPNTPYLPSTKNMKQVSNEHLLLEIPQTIVRQHNYFNKGILSRIRTNSLTRKIMNKVMPEICWLRPNGHNLGKMKDILDKAIQGKWEYVMFMLHSSELMPRGNPYFKSPKKIEKLYIIINDLFEYAQNKFKGKTLKEFYTGYIETQKGVHNDL